jgi:Ca2+-binding RTX toxin-like protein
MMAPMVDAMVWADSLWILGTPGNDEVVVRQAGDQIEVKLSTETSSEVVSKKYSRAAMNTVYFFGFDGNDLFWNNSWVPFTAYGGPGNDALFGGLATNRLEGNAGDDVLIGGSQNDTINGGDGDDFVNGLGGNDTIDGGAGRDQLYGGDGDDTIGGGDGADVISGDSGNDQLDGGAEMDFIGGGSGNDVINGGLDFDLLYGGTGADVVRGGAGDDLIRGGEGNDAIYGDDGHDLVWGDGGDDKLYGRNGDDLLFGAAGNDQIRAGAGHDAVFGGDGVDWIWGDVGDDQLFGDGNIDVIFGGDGDDLVDGGTGYDYLFGDVGTDRLHDAAGGAYRTGGSSVYGSATPQLSTAQTQSDAMQSAFVGLFVGAMFDAREQLSVTPSSSESLFASAGVSGLNPADIAISSSFGGSFANTSHPSSSTSIGTGNLFGGDKFYADATAEGLVLAGSQNGALIGQFFHDPRNAALNGGALTGVQTNQALMPYLGMDQGSFNSTLIQNLGIGPLLSGATGLPL